MKITNHADARQWAAQQIGLRSFDDVSVDENGNVFCSSTTEAIRASAGDDAKVWVVKQNGEVNYSEVLLD